MAPKFDNPMTIKRPTIGYLTPHIKDEVGHAIWSGIAETAQKRDVNLIAFVGERVKDARDFRTQANIIYDMVNPGRLDGLISWTSSLFVFIDDEEQAKFHERYHPLPIVGLGATARQMPCVLAEGYQGMRELIAHLVEVHGYQRLAFVRGLESHPYMQERYLAYLDALKAYNLPIDPNLITPPEDWLQSDGQEIVQLLLDQRGLRPKVDFEVVVAFSDRPAIGVLNALRQRGIQVPGEISVVGFNDSMEGRTTTPALTSVAVSFYEQGKQAVEMLLARLEGRPVPEKLILPARLVVRRSCGCLSEVVLQASVSGYDSIESTPKQPLDFNKTPAVAQAEIVSEMVQAMMASPDSTFLGWAEQLFQTFWTDLPEQEPRTFLLTLEEILSKVPSTGKRIWDWQRALSVLRCRLLPLVEPELLPQAENIWQQARVLIGEIARHSQISVRFQVEQQAEILREISQTMATSFNLTELMDVLAHKLPHLGISACYLSLYENPSSPTEWSRLILAYNDQGRLALEPAGQRFRTGELVPSNLLPTHRRVTLVIKALYFQEQQLGFIVFEGKVQTARIYQALCNQISSVLKGAQLFKQNIELYNEALQARTAAEKANQLKTRLLANVSHELRHPLDIILGYTQLALKAPQTYNALLPPTLLKDLDHIHYNAEYLRRVIDDLLDLSRAEIDELNLCPELIQPQKFLEDVFQDMTDGSDSYSQVTWRLQIPERLPLLQADPIRLRQILLNLLSNARKFTDQGQIELGAEVTPPYLHLWVQDTGIGIPPEMRERIFEPFVIGENTRRSSQGIGLGLSITRQLVALHRGLIRVDSQPGQGSTFHVYLPLPSLSDQSASISPSAQPVLLLISAQEQPPSEIVKLSQRRGLEIRRIQVNDNIERLLAEVQPTALAWDFAAAAPGDWGILQQLRNMPRLRQIPFMLYGQEQESNGEPTIGLTNLIIKPVSDDTLLGTIQVLCPPHVTGPILIVDDDPQIVQLYRSMVAKSLPGYPIRTAENGLMALEIMAETLPSLVVLDLMMPKMNGFEVLKRMRANEKTRYVPVLVLSGQTLSLEDVKQLEPHALVTFHSKGILSEAEAAAALHRALFGADALPPHTSTLVKRTVAYIHQHYDRTITRQEIAEDVGASKDYLSEIFRQELGLSPWEYLNRYRILHAKALLRHTDDSITNVALKVGFNDPSYFGRVFHHQVGLTPRAYKKNFS